MGVPGLYRTLFQKYTNTYRWVTPGSEHVDYFYLDFNPIVYVCFFNLFEEGKIGPELTQSQVEKKLIAEVIKVTAHIINVLVQPTKMVYIALDGPAPKCKLVLQRARRYKNLLEQRLKEMIQSKYPNAKREANWSKSNITPGTKFMHTLCIALRKAIAQGIFSQHPIDQGFTVVFSDSNIPGEGEHKITAHIRNLQCQKEDIVCVYSNDGDLIILGCQFPDKNLLILTNPSFLPKSVVENHDLKTEYIYVDHNEFRQELFASLGELTEPELVAIRKPSRLLMDFMALSFLAGNDFVRPIPFLKMRYQNTLQTLLDIYTRIVIDSFTADRYLVTEDGLNFDQEILTEIIFELAKMENFKMKEYQQTVLRSKTSENNWGPHQTWEEEWSDYQHTCYYNPRHPEFNDVKEEFYQFKYDNPTIKHEWKAQYYNYFFDLPPDLSKHEYNITRTKVCVKYLKSLIFTLRYYTQSVPPNWRWNYPDLVAPWPSDLLVVLEKTDLNQLGQFTPTRREDIYTPFEQLLLTIPKQSECFPKEYASLTKYLPTVDTVELDIVSGEKYIYAEPKLPNFNEILLLREAKKIQLPPDSAVRNSINSKLFVRRF